MELEPTLAAAQNAINLPEVQDMVKRLGEYGLAVFMPHMHDADGNFTPKPDGVVQMEDDMQVSFRPEDQIGEERSREYLPVGWRWSEARQCSSPDVVCRIVKQSNGEYKHVGTASSH